MAFPTSNNNAYLALSLKLALISTAVFSGAVILKLSFPSAAYFAVSELPVMYASLLSWLRPPYLYLVINGIIISIVASSKLQLQKPDEPPLKPSENINPTVITASADKGSGDVLYDYAVEEMQVRDDGGDGVVASPEKSPEPPCRSQSIELLLENLVSEKPLLSARFGHKKSVKASTEGSGGQATMLGVSKSKRKDTLESTWKMITEGRGMPITRHLKKSDTWITDGRQTTGSSLLATPLENKMAKSETFSENSSSVKLSQKLNRQRSGKLRKEPSLSQDELNRRVEAFIKKFNEEMRLQRQESWNKYQEMINRGAH